MPATFGLWASTMAAAIISRNKSTKKYIFFGSRKYVQLKNFAPSPAKFISAKLKKWPKTLYITPCSTTRKAKNTPSMPMAMRRPRLGSRAVRQVISSAQQPVKAMGLRLKSLVPPTPAYTHLKA